jgi:Tfp pilus assembly protein PilZ
MDDYKKLPFDKKTRISADEELEIKSKKNILKEDRSDRNPEEELKFDYISYDKVPFSKEEMKDNPRPVEKRSYPRKPCFFPVNYATSDRAYQEFIQNISNSGAFVETRHLLSIGQNISITFSLPGSQRNIKMKGSVARVAPQGIGIAFILENDDQKEYMRTHMVEV